jgi:Flp pilus assembly pilin Flp
MTTIEYGLLAALMAIATLVALPFLGDHLACSLDALRLGMGGGGDLMCVVGP